MLHQFQCQKEGTLFYYQHGNRSVAHIISSCPVCGSKRVTATGRTFPDVDESSADEDEDAEFPELLVVVRGQATAAEIAELETIVGCEASSVDEIGGNTDVLFHVDADETDRLAKQIQDRPNIVSVTVGEHDDGSEPAPGGTVYPGRGPIIV